MLVNGRKRERDWGIRMQGRNIRGAFMPKASWEGGVVEGGIGEVGQAEGFLALDAGGTASAMAGGAFVAGVCEGEVGAGGGSSEGNLGFSEIGIGCQDGDTVVGPLSGGLGHGVDEAWTTVGVDGMVAAVVGKHQLFQAAAFGKTAGNGKHYAVAEGNYRGFHIAVMIMSFRDCVSTFKQR